MSGTVLSGTARAQTLDFDAVNEVFQTSVVQLTGMENAGEANAPRADAAIGVLSIAKDSSISLTCDANNAGTVNVNQTLSGKLASYAALDTDSSSGALTGMAYATSISTEAGQLATVTFQGTFSIADATTGRGNAMLPAGFYGDFTQQTLSPASFYLIGPNRFVSIRIQSGSSSGISYFSPY